MRTIIAVGLAAFVAMATVAPLFAQGTIDLNTASASELEKLPGVGPKTAAKIVAEREANGPFASLQDVEKRVKGIGPKSILKWAEMATVGAAAPAAAPAAAAPAEVPAAAPAEVPAAE
jgi:competence ComEA-like helix-hairpin-helix protein